MADPNYTHCDNEHDPTLTQLLEQLPLSQKDINGRHRCAAHAFEAGHSIGFEEGIREGERRAIATIMAIAAERLQK